MDEIIEENPKKEEKKAFYVGLATITVLILLVGLTIFFIKGCSDKNQEVKEVKDNGVKTEEAAKTVSSPVTSPAEGVVAGQTTPTTLPANAKTYTIESGDTLYEIGKKFKVDWHRIAEVNGIDNSGALKVGKQIIIPSE